MQGCQNKLCTPSYQPSGVAPWSQNQVDSGITKKCDISCTPEGLRFRPVTIQQIPTWGVNPVAEGLTPGGEISVDHSLVTLPDSFLPHQRCLRLWHDTAHQPQHPSSVLPGIQGKPSVSSLPPCLDVVYLKKEIFVGWRSFSSSILLSKCSPSIPW